MQGYTVGRNIKGKSDPVTVEAEDALAAALQAKQEAPEATITYVRKRNERGDRRHPHREAAAAKADETDQG
jgi:hypothetical protein